MRSHRLCVTSCALPYFLYPSVTTDQIQDLCDAVTKKGLRRNDSFSPDEAAVVAMLRKYAPDVVKSLIPSVCDVVYFVDGSTLDPTTSSADREFLKGYCPGIYREWLIPKSPAEPIQWYPEFYRGRHCN